MKNIFYGEHRKRNIVLYTVLLFSWLTFIFFNSSANGIESTAQTNKVVEFIKNFLQNFSADVMLDLHYVRKTAHFLEFFILGALYYTGSFFIKASRVSLFFHSLSLSLFTAFVDETIQIFSYGRSAEVKDIWIDFSGAFIAHIILFAIYYSYKHFKKS